MTIDNLFERLERVLESPIIDHYLKEHLRYHARLGDFAGLNRQTEFYIIRGKEPRIYARLPTNTFGGERIVAPYHQLISIVEQLTQEYQPPRTTMEYPQYTPTPRAPTQPALSTDLQKARSQFTRHVTSQSLPKLDITPKPTTPQAPSKHTEEKSPTLGFYARLKTIPPKDPKTA